MADELFLWEEFGQEERLTTRLNRLLEDYTDGFAVLKELIQNADDAGATEVKFLYDERTNDDALTCLLDENMRGCQGPALWVYNDATFNDEDFENITRLNEATKFHDTEKIGRFGLGFNAVYNLTDVPMFVSRNYFVIFDPHTTYLGNVIKDKRKPGIRVDLNKDVKALRRFKNQFKPFNGIFGCDLQLKKEDYTFDGTLFRFPLRTKEQAARSEIKKLFYSDQEMRQLLEMLLNRGKSLLFFTQNLLHLEVYRVSGSSRQGLPPELMFQVTKSMLEGGIMRKLSVPVTLPATAIKLDEEQQNLLKQCNFLQATSEVAKKARSHAVEPFEFPESSTVVDIYSLVTGSGLKFFKRNEHFNEECETWLVVSSMGNGQALRFSKSDSSLLPSAGVAVQLKPKESGNFVPLPVVKEVEGYYPNGTIFCYLPLPIHSGLPVHINGPFAVTSSRRHLQKKLEDDKTCYGVEWNNILLQDSVVSTFLKLLEDVKKIIPDDGSYAYHSLWPRACHVCQDCWPFLKSFYQQITSRGHPLFSDGRTWVDFSQVVFLHPNIRWDPEIGNVSFAVLQRLAKRHCVVIDMPDEVFQSLLHCRLGDKIKDKTYDKTRFFRDLFFPKILRIPANERNELLLYALKRNSRDLNELIRKHACIPASPNGNALKRPSQLINPNQEASFLFCRDDGRFPFGKEDTFLHPQVLVKLEELGMKSIDLPWEDIAERAESVQRLALNAANSEAAIRRSEVLLDFVEKKLKRTGMQPPNPVLTRLLRAQFLPVLQRPESFPLPWKGDEFQSRGNLMVAPKNIYLMESMYLVCCTEPIVGLEVPKKMRGLLRLEDKEVTAKHVLEQLERVVSTNIDTLDRNGYEATVRVCTEAYSYLQDNMDSLVPSAKQFLLGRKFILLEKDKLFTSAACVAFELSADCSPYLFKLPEDFSHRFQRIMKFSGVRKQFEATDYISSLVAIKQKFNGKQLDETTLQVAVNMANQLAVALDRSCVDACEVQDELGGVYLPDSKKVMRNVAKLCFKECPWMPDDPDEIFVHEKIPWSTCEKLAVKTRRDEALQQHDIGLPFGQKEKLTNRLRRILTGYQGEKEILKELLQNADDAQATEICFIKDPRQHPDKRVFKDSWKPLQGPALCVYNNKPFTNADIEGICNLGEGSKGEDPNKTGQYGVGFNAVYQLTDVPSFISKGEEIGDVLCVFDPHCKYIPHSSEDKPGRKFKDIDVLKEKFPDVFPCYLEEHFPIQNATMFRFPLKSEKMARESKICQTSVTVEKLDEMMKDLKNELFEVLLFVNSVKKISIAALDKRGKLKNNYYVEVVMSKDDARKREEFSCYVKEIGKQVKEKKILPINVKMKKRSYTLQLQDSHGKSEKWLIVQQVGLEKPVPESVTDAFQERRLGMLPRGGVACLLDSTCQLQRVKRAYCFLPLPMRTNLPVHINGHFALDHETRRKLWRDEAGGYRSDWNRALLNDVIASCYLTLLDEVRAFIQLPVSQTRSALPCNKTMIVRSISTYEQLFPSYYPLDDPFWKTLADAVYQEMNKKKMPLIPLVRGVEEGGRGGSKDLQRLERVELSWFPATGTGRDQTYFNNLEIKGYFAPMPPRRDETEEDRNRREQSRIKRKAAFEGTLLETGFNLVAFSLNMFHSLKEAGVEVCCVSPSAVMEFYKSFSDDDPLCRIGAVPCPVTKTPFKNIEGVVRVLQYCKDDDNFLESLPGLPLLLTQDNRLQPFSERHPRCLSRYLDILPHSERLFVHSRFFNSVFSSADAKKVAVFRPLDVETFASQLHLTLPHRYRSKDHYVQWYPDGKSASLPSLRWINRVWDFLQDFAHAAIKEAEVKEESITAFIRDLFSPLSIWSLLPSTKKSSLRSKEPVVTHFLVPLNKAEAVLDFKDCGASGQKLVDALRNLGLPELNTVPLTTQSIGSLYSKWGSYELARNLVATVSSPHSLLFALNQKLQWDPSGCDNKLKLSDAIVVLAYFSRNIESLTSANREILKKLPFYPSANGVLRNLEGRKAFVIPCDIPSIEMSVVEAKLGCLLLKSRHQLSDLFEFLQLKSVSPVEVYINFVLKCFQHLSLEGRLNHLRFIREDIWFFGNENDCEKKEKERLFDRLKSVELIPSANGTLKTVSSFYDPANEVFVAMLSQDSFPPEPFNSEEWLTFLRKIGLVQDVSHQNFLRFAKQVEREAETARTDDTYKKSEVLVYHLISRPNVVDEGLLPLVRDIAFVAADPVDKLLQAICPPFRGTKRGEIPFIAFGGAIVSDHEKIVWTEAHSLPRRADPRYNLRYLRCPHRNIDRYLNNLLDQLKVAAQPSVDLVVNHCQKICYHLGGNELEREHVSSQDFSTITEVMQSIYSFLQKNAMTDSEAKQRLQKIRCVLVEQGRKLIFPRQAILELYEHLEIRPFLYRLPPEFGMFHPLFEFLGCSKTPTPIHYAIVLEMLQKNSQGELLHPNEVRTCSKAVEGFFDSLQEKAADVSTLSTMYLPAMPSRVPVQNSSINTVPVCLQESRELVFDDAPTYGNRIQGLNQLFVLDLSLMNVRCKSAKVTFEDLLMKLPLPLQPVMLSTVVKEKLIDPENAVMVNKGVVNALKQQLSSAHFGLGIARITRHTNSREENIDKGVTANIQEDLRAIKLSAVKSLRTALFYKGLLISGSEDEVPYFTEKIEASDGHIWRVYVNATTTKDDTISLSTLVAKVIVEMYGEHLGKNAFLIPEMLQCPPAMIQSLLDTHGIRKDESNNAVQMTIYPELGTLIPIEDHHLLDYTFEKFEPEDYVGFQLHDPILDLMEGTATYIHAIIIEEVTDEDVSLLTKSYRINIGNDEPVKVKATKLFKFCRLEAIFDEHSGCHRDKQEVLDEISRMLREAWESHVSEEKRRQIIKRLCLRWDPKNNAGNEEFYRSVFQHVKNEVARLGGSYDVFFYFLGERAREHSSQRAKYRRNFRERFGSWESSSSQRSWRNFPPSFCTRNPQPQEAKRWLRQAKADLDAGSEEFDFSTSSFEWMCFKFHQAAEKALKAARYSKDADKTNVHNLVENCYGLEDPELVQSARKLENLVGDSTRMRYPDRMSYPQIPNDVYSRDMAAQARGIAEKIVERVEEKLS